MYLHCVPSLRDSQHWRQPGAGSRHRGAHRVPLAAARRHDPPGRAQARRIANARALSIQATARRTGMAGDDAPPDAVRREFGCSPGRYRRRRRATEIVPG
jgi:hypothetical protein